MSITKFCRLFRCNYSGYEAGIPRTDASGSISSHRARSTIAGQLFNAREPTTLLNCKPCQVTRHGAPYVSTSPTKLAQAYKDADYFSRNVRAIEVLVDRQGIVQRKATIKNGYFLHQVGPIIRFSQIFYANGE